MDGILNVYKTKGMTSHDVVNKIRHIFKTKQVGHTGTLDPNAEGVLVICINAGTKLVQFLEADTKKYRAELVIGKATDTYDITGNVMESKKDFNIEYNQVKQVIESFVGKQKQIPPIYSAIKVNGKKLYNYALKNEEVKIEARDIEIIDIKIFDKEIIQKEDYYSLTFDVTVSKGTYIRSLCHDIGKALGIPCCMGELLRLRSGAFNIEDAKKLEEIEQGDYTLKGLVESIGEIKKINISNNLELMHKVTHGMKISLKTFDEKYNQIAFIDNDQLLAIYEEYQEEKYQYYRAVRVWK